MPKRRRFATREELVNRLTQYSLNRNVDRSSIRVVLDALAEEGVDVQALVEIVVDEE